MVESCGQSAPNGALDATITAIPSERSASSSSGLGGRGRGEDPVAIQIALRRALTIGCAMWTSFFVIDLAVVHYMNAGPLAYFGGLRVAVLGVMLTVLLRLFRKQAPSELSLRVCDVLAYTAPAVGMALMCIEFRGLTSPYVPGVCLVLLGRTVTSQDPWRRGLTMTGIPVASFFGVLFGSALFSPRIAAQIHEPAAVTTLAINSAYVLATYVLLVMGGHIVWSLRRQVFEARSLGRYRLKRRLASEAWATSGSLTTRASSATWP